MRRVWILLASALIAGCGIPTAKAKPTPRSAVLGVATALPNPYGSVYVTPIKEPNDYAHRNYCGAGATQVLLSGWFYPAPVPNIETVAQLSHLDPNHGQSGANTVTAINEFLAYNAGLKGKHAVYQGRHIDNITDLVSAIRADLSGSRWAPRLRHGGPVIVQVMTASLPGWNHRQTTDMVTIFSFSFATGDPAKDTVTYMETPSTVAGYNGQAIRIITVAALWQAMVAYNQDAPDDPINLIS